MKITIEPSEFGYSLVMSGEHLVRIRKEIVIYSRSLSLMTKLLAKPVATKFLNK